MDYNNLFLDYNNLLPDYDNHIIIYYYYNPRININPSCPEDGKIEIPELCQNIGLGKLFLEK